MKFRKKPVVIEAVQWTDMEETWAIEEFTDWAAEHDEKCSGGIGPDGEDWGLFEISTLEGTMEISPMDWVIRGVQGEYYPCKPDIFEQTYEPVSS